MAVVARGKGSRVDIASSLRTAVRQQDAALPAGTLLSMHEVLSRSLAQPRFTMLLMGAFAVTAVLVAAVGLYGLISYLVEQRRQEIGVRLALGATGADVRRLVVGEGMRLTALGLGLGLVVALAGSRLLESLLFEVGANDPATFLGVCGFLALVSLAASLVPAVRAARVDPLLALRGE